MIYTKNNVNSMKQCFLLSALFVIGMAQAVADDSAPVKVSTTDEFVAAVKANKDIVLTDNIDMTGLATIETSFEGSINGLGKEDGEDVIYRIYKEGEEKHFTPLIAIMNGATVQNVMFSGFRVQSNDSNQGVIGTLIGCNFDNVVFQNISVFSDDDNAGAVAGAAIGCNFTNVKVLNSDVTVDGVCAGAFVGSSALCHFTQCLSNLLTRVFADGTAISPNAAYAGGICGYSSFDDYVECINMGIVCANDDQAGGIVGHSEGGNFYACSNLGYVYQADEESYLKDFDVIQQKMRDQLQASIYTETAGALAMLAGLGTASIVSMAAASIFPPAAIIVAAGSIIAGTVIIVLGAMEEYDVVGGICGKALDGEFSCCSNYGTCAVVGTYVGGIVGYTDRMNKHTQGVSIKNCLNAGQVYGSSCVGGIAGGLCNSSIFNCLNVGLLRPNNANCLWGPFFGNEENGTWGNVFYKAGAYEDNVYNKDGKVLNCTLVTDEQLANGQVTWWLNDSRTDGPWRQNLEGENADDYPTLYADHNTVSSGDITDRIIIGTADELMNFAKAVNEREDVNQTFVVYLTADITLTEAWTPIGTKEKPFRGLFFGCGHIIDHLVCNSGKSDVGLFGTIGVRTEIYDVTVGHNSHIMSTENAVGGIVGCVREPEGTLGTVKIIGCGNRASVTGKYNVGGILGAVYFDNDLLLEVRDCYNAGFIHATGRGEGNTGTGESAVLCGCVKANSVITDCWNLTTVSVATSTDASPSPSTAYYNGRYFVYYSGNKPQISHCYSLLTSMGDDQEGVEEISVYDISDGTLCYLLNNETNDTSKGLHWEMELGDASTMTYTGYDTAGRGIYHSRTISNSIGTIVLPYDVESDDYITYYMLTSATDEVMHFTSVKVLPAGTPAVFLLSSEIDDPITLEFLGTGETFKPDETLLEDVYIEPGWSMNGTYSEKVITSFTELENTYYINGGKVRQATRSITIAPYRAYLQCKNPVSIGANGLRVSFDGQPTDIVLIPVDQPTAADANTDGDVTYDLFGRRATIPQNGIYIQDGKKFMINR